MGIYSSKYEIFRVLMMINQNVYVINKNSMNYKSYPSTWKIIV